jgi:Domain of unknown function (DUF4349)
MSRTIFARHAALGGIIVITGCLLLAACSSGGSVSGTSRAAEERPAAMAPGPADYKAAASGADTSAGTTAGLTSASQSIIYTASITVRSRDVTATARQAVSIALAAGGYTADEKANSGRPGAAAGAIELTLKIPVASYQAALAQLSSPRLGKQVSLQQQATDVTAQVANVDSLVTSQQDAIAALQGLLKRAASVSGLLQVQQQISTDESTLNSLLAQQRALDHETSYATVTMNLQTTPRPPHHKRPVRHGFAAGLKSGWRGLEQATTWLLTALGALLPFLIVIAAVGAIGYTAWRRLGRRRAGPTAAS